LPDKNGQRFTGIPEILTNLSKEMIMKLKLTLAAGLFAVIAALSLNAGAASDTAAGAKTASGSSPGAKVERAAHQTKMGPHSRAEVKTGFPQRTPVTMQDKPNPAKDMSKHFHPRDGK
jgi:hypothetical protein